MIKLTARKKLDEDSEFGIKGFFVEATFIKSRSTASGVTCMLVYDQVNGFDNLLTNYILVKEMGHLGGGGQGFYLKEYPSVKFTQKKFKEKYKENPEFAEAFNVVAKECLEAFIPRPRREEASLLGSTEVNPFEGYEQYEDENGNPLFLNPANGKYYDINHNEIQINDDEVVEE